MPEKIVIEGGMVRVYNEEPVSEARLVDLLPHIESRPPITVGLLPKSAIIFYWDESNAKKKRAAFVCEMTPGVRSANFNDKLYPISLPWTYFLFDFETGGNPLDGHTLWTHSNSRVYWAKEQVQNMDSMVGTALVPNCDVEGGICYGTTAVDANLPLGVRVDRLVDEFYRSAFTHDSGTGSPFGGSERGAESWANWVKETAKNPHAWRDMPEWEQPRRIRMRPLRDVVGVTHNRMEPIQLHGTIPEMVTPMTFRRAEEWLDLIGEDSITKLEVAIRNRRADAVAETPVEAPVEEAPAPATTTRITRRTTIRPVENG